MTTASRTQAMQALNLYDSISIKNLRPVYGGRVADTSPTCMQVRCADDGMLYIFRFGCIVAFGVAGSDLDGELEQLEMICGPRLAHPTSEMYEVELGAATEGVEFGRVALSAVTTEKLILVAQTLAQSAALEYFELDADDMLRQTTAYFQSLARHGNVPLRSKDLLKFVGIAAVKRQHVTSNLAILDAPEGAWTRQDLERLFNSLQENFDIGVRFRVLDKKLGLVQENLQLIVDLAAARRATLLEVLIIVLIAVELMVALLAQV